MRASPCLQHARTLGLMDDITASIGDFESPIALTTAPGTSAYTMHRDGDVLVCRVGTTTLRYRLRAVQDLAAWLAEQGDWVPLGGADENKPAPEGLRAGYRGRFGVYLPPLLEKLGLVELEHDPRNNRVRFLP